MQGQCSLIQMQDVSGPASHAPTKLQPQRQDTLGVGGGTAGMGSCASYRPHQSPFAAPHRSFTTCGSGLASCGNALRSGWRLAFAFCRWPPELPGVPPPLLLPPPPPPSLTAALPSSVLRRLAWPCAAGQAKQTAAAC